jgi:hypothetical protein
MIPDHLSGKFTLVAFYSDEVLEVVALKKIFGVQSASLYKSDGAAAKIIQTINRLRRVLSNKHLLVAEADKSLRVNFLFTTSEKCELLFAKLKFSDNFLSNYVVTAEDLLEMQMMVDSYYNSYFEYSRANNSADPNYDFKKNKIHLADLQAKLQSWNDTFTFI